MAKNTYGTDCSMLMNTGSKAITSKNGLVTTIAFGMDGCVDYVLQGVYLSQDILDVMQEDAGIILKTLKLDGRASSSNFLIQF